MCTRCSKGQVIAYIGWLPSALFKMLHLADAYEIIAMKF